MARATREELFQKEWEDIIPTLTDIDVDKWLVETSPHHPNENMRWLYDRLIMKKAGIECHI